MAARRPPSYTGPGEPSRIAAFPVGRNSGPQVDAGKPLSISELPPLRRGMRLLSAERTPSGTRFATAPVRPGRRIPFAGGSATQTVDVEKGRPAAWPANHTPRPILTRVDSRSWSAVLSGNVCPRFHRTERACNEPPASNAWRMKDDDLFVAAAPGPPRQRQQVCREAAPTCLATIQPESNRSGNVIGKTTRLSALLICPQVKSFTSWTCFPIPVETGYTWAIRKAIRRRTSSLDSSGCVASLFCIPLASTHLGCRPRSMRFARIRRRGIQRNGTSPRFDAS